MAYNIDNVLKENRTFAPTAEFAKNAGVHVEREIFEVIALLASDGRLALARWLYGDDARRADAFARQARDAGLVTALIVNQRKAGPIALGAHAVFRRVLDRRRRTKYVSHGHAHRPRGIDEVAHQAPTPP